MTTLLHTETTLKARHQEALDIHEAWADRVRTSGGHDRTAAILQMQEAWDWVEQTKNDLDLHRQVTRQRPKNLVRSAQNTTVRLRAHRTH